MIQISKKTDNISDYSADDEDLKQNFNSSNHNTNNISSSKKKN